MFGNKRSKRQESIRKKINKINKNKNKFANNETKKFSICFLSNNNTLTVPIKKKKKRKKFPRFQVKSLT